MKLKRRKIDGGAPFVMMADLAFNLVLFFLILVRVQDDSHLQWEAAQGTRLVRAENVQASITVNNENEIYLNGVRTGTGDLAKGLTERFGDNPPENRVVLLKIHKEATAAIFEPILEAVGETGGQVVHVLEEKQ